MNNRVDMSAKDHKNKARALFAAISVMIIASLMYFGYTGKSPIEDTDIEQVVYVPESLIGEITHQIPEKVKPSSPDFNFVEFSCKDDAHTPVPEEYWSQLQELMNLLEEIRLACGNRPIEITSGYRTPEHNDKVGGAQNSYHLEGAAADIYVRGLSIDELYEICNLSNPNGGIDRANTFIHVDVRGYHARWDY